MDYPELLRKKALFEQAKDTLPEVTVKSYMQAFELEYTHNSTAIEGNTLTLLETKVVLMMAHGFLPVSIAKEARLDYFNALEAYAVQRDLNPFADMIASLEEHQLDRYLGNDRTASTGTIATGMKRGPAKEASECRHAAPQHTTNNISIRRKQAHFNVWLLFLFPQKVRRWQ